MDNPSKVDISLYGGKVKGVWYPNIHSFKINGKPVKSVTGIIGIKDKSTPLGIWQEDITRHFLMKKLPQGITGEDILEAVNLHNVRKDKSAEIGTLIHEWVEGYIKFKLKKPGYSKRPKMPDDKNIIIGVNSFLEFESQHDIEYIDSECLTYSKEHEYFGWLDIDAVIDGKRGILDLKTGNGIYNSVMLQTAAYAHSRAEELGIKYECRWAINVSKETEAEYEERMLEKGKVAYSPYQVLKAVNLDTLFPGRKMEDDFKGFLAAKELTLWDDATDFYKNKIKI